MIYLESHICVLFLDFHLSFSVFFSALSAHAHTVRLWIMFELKNTWQMSKCSVPGLVSLFIHTKCSGDTDALRLADVCFYGGTLFLGNLCLCSTPRENITGEPRSRQPLWSGLLTAYIACLGHQFPPMCFFCCKIFLLMLFCDFPPFP